MLGAAWRWPFVILAGAAATLMAIRPLGSVRLLRKIMVWLVLAASVFLFVQVLLQPRQSIPQESVLGFWPAVDLAVAGVIFFRWQRTTADTRELGRPPSGEPSGLRPRRRRLLHPRRLRGRRARRERCDHRTGHPPGRCHRDHDPARRRGG